MSQTFTLSSHHKYPDHDALHFTHLSGLNHVNIGALAHETELCGAFFINTPSHDDSGIAHALEHLVFRQSRHFPNSSTLFQLLAMTDIRLNASTLDSVTCFHFSSHDPHCFYLAARYLLAGILFPSLDTKICQQEVFNGGDEGVIYRELLGYQSNRDYLQHVQVLRGDQSAQRIACYGGVTDTLAEISIDKLRHYHRYYYRCDNIELITNVDDVQRLHKEINQVLPSQPQSIRHPVFTSIANTASRPTMIEQTSTVYTWWLSSPFHAYIKSMQPALSELIQSLGATLLPLSNECNSADQFPLRICYQGGDIKRLHRQLIALLDTQQVYVQPHLVEFSKQPKSIQRLMAFYCLNRRSIVAAPPPSLGHQLRCQPHTSQLATVSANTIERPNAKSAPVEPPKANALITQLRTLPPPRFKTRRWQDIVIVELSASINTPVIAKLVANKLSVRAIAYRSKLVVESDLGRHQLLSIIDHLVNQHSQCQLPELPQLLLPLVEQLSAKTRWCVNQQCWLYRLPLKPEQRLLGELTQYIIQASTSFMAPRLKGECYAISTKYCGYTNQLFFYSVFDNNINARQQHLSQALSAIAADQHFITQTLVLAKSKLLHQYPLQSSAFTSEQLDTIMPGLNDKVALNQLAELLQQISETCLVHFLFQLTNEIINNHSQNRDDYD